MPAPEVVIPGIVVFCASEEKPFGPVQTYVPAPPVPVKLRVTPVQTGFGDALAVGAAGAGVTESETIPVKLWQVVTVLVATTE